MKCIYCLKDESHAQSNGREHVIPRTIGGKNTLNRGVICDECNNRFSGLEKKFVYNSAISLPKQFSGPKGRKGQHKSNLHPMINIVTEEVNVGYIEQGGIPKYPIQFKVLDKNQLTFTGLSGDENKVNDLIEQIVSTPEEEIIQVVSSKIPEKQPIVCFFKSKVFAFINNKQDYEKVSQLKQKLTKGRFCYSTDDVSTSKYHVQVNQAVGGYSLDDYLRVVAKMVFNCFAYYHGSGFVLQSCFDDLRNYILNGLRLDNHEFVIQGFDSKEVSKDVLGGFKEKAEIAEDSHYVVIGNINSEYKLISFTKLYNSFVYYVINNKPIPDIMQKVHIVDWRNNEEFELFNEMPKRLFDREYCRE